MLLLFEAAVKDYVSHELIKVDVILILGASNRAFA